MSRLKGVSAMPPPPPSAPPGSFQERERQPYSQSASASNAFDDDDLVAPSMPIERERKPYTAKEGAGKTYNPEDSRSPTTAYRPDAPPSNTRTTRVNSAMPQLPTYNNNGGSDPINIQQRPPQRLSTNQAGIPPQQSNGPYSRSAKRSSPPTRNQFARSEQDVSGGGSQVGSNSFQQQGRDQYPNDMDDDPAKRYRSRSRVERNSNPNDEDARGYPTGGRGVPISNGYEYGSGGGPPIGQQATQTPVGSFPATRWPPMSGGPGGDNRRQSMYSSTPNYGGGNGEGGTDGYGSFANNGGYTGGPPPQQSYGSSSQH